MLVEFQIVVAVLLLVLLVFLATIDIAFSHVTDVGMRRLSSEEEAAGRKRVAALLREILENRARFRFLLSSGIQILLVSFGVVVTVLLTAFLAFDGQLSIAALTIALLATAAFRQILPRLIVRRNYEKSLLMLAPVIRPLFAFALAITSPFVYRTASKDDPRIDVSLTPDAIDVSEDNSDDLTALMEVGEAEGIIEERDREMIETMVEFSDTIAAEIMTPRTEIVAVSVEATIRDARDMMIAEKYSRLPVYRETVDNIEGVIYVRDLLQAWADGMDQMQVGQVLRDAFFVPETKTASELLKSMQLNHVQIAIVIDEYGGVAGLVTAEDIIEEIVGEIEDEDTGRDEIIEIIEGDDGYFDVLGSTEIDKIERLFDLELEDEEYTTIAGLVVTDAGYVPKVGEDLTIRGLDIHVLKADEKRVNLLRLRRSVVDDEADVSDH